MTASDVIIPEKLHRALGVLGHVPELDDRDEWVIHIVYIYPHPDLVREFKCVAIQGEGQPNRFDWQR